MPYILTRKNITNGYDGEEIKKFKTKEEAIEYAKKPECIKHGMMYVWNEENNKRNLTNQICWKCEIWEMD